mgnify:CR=1 FL=1
MKTEQHHDLASCASQAIRESLEVLSLSDAADGRVHHEAGRDIKLQADLLLSSELTERLTKATGIPCLSEEDAASHGMPSGNAATWIVDPLDGSMNFTRSLPLYCVSIALWGGGKPEIGIIHDIPRGVTMIGYDGVAKAEGTSMRVSRVQALDKAVLATGFPVLMDTSPENTGWFLDFADAFKKVRMLGSAALSMAWVAQGRLDVYFEKDIMIWDIAAGAALVRGAGGVCLMRLGSHPLSLDVLAANADLAEAARKRLEWE